MDMFPERKKARRKNNREPDLQPIQVTEDEVAVGVAEVHAAAAAVFPELAGGAGVLFHPGAVSEGAEAVFPHVHEIVLVNVALVIIGPYAGAGRYGAVGQHGTNGDAGLAHVEMAADIALVMAQKAFAGELCGNDALAARGADEFQKADMFLTRKL